MTGWDYHGGWSHPVFDGFVVCEEHVEMLLDAWQVEELLLIFLIEGIISNTFHLLLDY